MSFIDCPVIGRRNVSEFARAGSTVELLRETVEASARRRLNFGDATARERAEWWFHSSSQLWFRVTRHTGTDAIVRVELARPFE